MSSSNSGPGIIGVTYECRLTRQDGTTQMGVLESRDEKCKTLMFRGEDGNSFNISFSTFKSNWRKYKGDNLIQTSTQVEESKEEVAEAKKVVEKTAKRKRISPEEKYKATHAAQQIVESIIHDTESSLIVKVNARGGIILKTGTKIGVEVWLNHKTHTFGICCRDDIYDILMFSEENSDLVDTVEHREGWKVPNLYEGLEMDRLESVVTDFVTSINDSFVAETTEETEEQVNEESEE